jgi:DNA-binding response OmpR family regulator
MPNTVLIVTGCKEWGSSLVRYFEKKEFMVTGCSNYREAERIAASEWFSIAIIDYFIGGADGGALCDTLARQQAADTALIIVSGRQSAGIERAIRRHSPAYYFVKPCSFENLHAVALRICCERDKKELQKNTQRQSIVKVVHSPRGSTRGRKGRKIPVNGKGGMPSAGRKASLENRPAGKYVPGSAMAGKQQ